MSGALAVCSEEACELGGGVRSPRVGVGRPGLLLHLLPVLSAEDVSFKLAPRLNAAGRLGCARVKRAECGNPLDGLGLLHSKRLRILVVG